MREWYYIEDFQTGKITIYCDIRSANIACDPSEQFTPRPFIEDNGDQE